MNKKWIALGLLLCLTGCSGGGNGTPSDMKSQPAPMEKPSEPEHKPQPAPMEKPSEPEHKPQPAPMEKPSEPEHKPQPAPMEKPSEPEHKPQPAPMEKPSEPEHKPQPAPMEKPSEPEHKPQPAPMEKPSEPEHKPQPVPMEKPSEPEHKPQPAPMEKPLESEDKPQPAPMDKPSAPETKPTPAIFEGKKVNLSTGNTEWNIAYDQLTVPRLILLNKVYETDDLVRKEGIERITVKNNEVGDHELVLLGEGGYYGYFRDTLDNKQIFKNYIYAVNQAFENKAIPQSFSATYEQKDGFMFSGNGIANAGGAKSDPNLQKKGDVRLKFENGKASGTVVINDGNGLNTPAFNLSGDVKILRVTPTNVVEGLNFNIRENDHGTMELHFIDSQPNANDAKHVVGATKADSWSGVLGATKAE